MEYCTQFKDMMRVEAEVIEESISFHQYCNHFSNTDAAIADFLTKYGWLMRTMYCKCKCPYKQECDLQNQGL